MDMASGMVIHSGTGIIMDTAIMAAARTGDMVIQIPQRGTIKKLNKGGMGKLRKHDFRVKHPE